MRFAEIVEQVAEYSVIRLYLTTKKWQYVTFRKRSPVSCDCLGWRYRKRCYHARLAVSLLQDCRCS